MQRSMEPVPGAGVKNYVFLVYSTDEEVVDTNNVLAKLMSGESENFKLGKVTVMGNPSFKPA